MLNRFFRKLTGQVALWETKCVVCTKHLLLESGLTSAEHLLTEKDLISTKSLHVASANELPLWLNEMIFSICCRPTKSLRRPGLSYYLSYNLVCNLYKLNDKEQNKYRTPDFFSNESDHPGRVRITSIGGNLQIPTTVSKQDVLMMITCPCKVLQ